MEDIASNTTATAASTSRGGWKKYHRYDLEVDKHQKDKATEIRICNFSRPHMRAFHASWWGFFVAFFTWFSVSPLLTEIRDDLDLSNADVWTSSIASVTGACIIRFILGPYCDKYGARILFSVLLCAAALPAACTGLVQTATGFAILRLFIGFVGGSFVMCQYWACEMFTPNVIGTANALVAGWGNLGAGVTQILVGSLLFPTLKLFYDGDSEKAWRRVTIIPAVVSLASGILIYFLTDDCPRGNYQELKKRGIKKDIKANKAFISGSLHSSTWLLGLQYACCFGVELTMNNAAALYFRDEYGQPTEAAAAIASIFGWMNLFARGAGGFFSDFYNTQSGMRGRLWVQALLLFLEGVFVLVFAGTRSLASSIIVMIFFSLFVQAAEGSTYGIVPYVDKKHTGTVTGIVGGSGNLGAVIFGVAFRQANGYRIVFLLMGVSIIASSFLTIFIRIRGQSHMFTKDADLFKIPDEVHEKDEEISNDIMKTKSLQDIDPEKQQQQQNRLEDIEEENEDVDNSEVMEHREVN